MIGGAQARYVRHRRRRPRVRRALPARRRMARRRRGVNGVTNTASNSPSIRLHQRAILSDRMFNCDGCVPSSAFASSLGGSSVQGMLMPLPIREKLAMLTPPSFFYRRRIAEEARSGEPELAVLGELLPQGGTAVDVGASLGFFAFRSEEHTSELQSLRHLVCRLLLEKKKP